MNMDTSLDTSKLSVEDVKQEIVKSVEAEKIREKVFAEVHVQQHEREQKKAHLDGVRKFYKMRSDWSGFIMKCIGASIAFHIVLTFLVGFDILDFKEYKWFLPIIVTENFLQIIGLAVIVVKFLFQDHDKSSEEKVRPTKIISAND